MSEPGVMEIVDTLVPYVMVLLLLLGISWTVSALYMWRMHKKEKQAHHQLTADEDQKESQP